MEATNEVILSPTMSVSFEEALFDGNLSVFADDGDDADATFDQIREMCDDVGSLLVVPYDVAESLYMALQDARDYIWRERGFYANPWLKEFDAALNKARGEQ